MISGTVLGNGDAVVLLRVRGTHGQQIVVRAIVDTGYSGRLTLSSNEIAGLGLLPFRMIQYALADGSMITSHTFRAEVEWHGRWRRVLIVEANGGNLLGMAMLRGNRLEVDVIDGGTVQITEIAAP